MHPILAVLGASLRISISLTKLSASNPVTSDTATILGNGTLVFSSVSSDGGTPQYSLNGGAWTNITEGGTLAVAAGNTLAVRASLITAGLSAAFEIRNNANSALIQIVGLQRL